MRIKSTKNRVLGGAAVTLLAAATMVGPGIAASANAVTTPASTTPAATTSVSTVATPAPANAATPAPTTPATPKTAKVGDSGKAQTVTIVNDSSQQLYFPYNYHSVQLSDTPETFNIPTSFYDATLTTHNGTPVDMMDLSNIIGGQANAFGSFYVGTQGGNSDGQTVVVTNANGLTFDALATQSTVHPNTVVWQIVITNAS